MELHAEQTSVLHGRGEGAAVIGARDFVRCVRGRVRIHEIKNGIFDAFEQRTCGSHAPPSTASRIAASMRCSISQRIAAANEPTPGSTSFSARAIADGSLVMC